MRSRPFLSACCTLLVVPWLACRELDQQVPHAVFDVALPAALEANPAPARQLGVVVEVTLTGKGGGTWTVDLKKAQVKKGAARAAELRVRMSVEDFAQATRGQLDVPSALQKKRITVEGNTDLLAAFFRILAGKH